MTSSELPAPPSPPPPVSGWIGRPPTRPPVPLDAPSRTSPLTIALEAIGLVLFGAGVTLDALISQGIDAPGILIGFIATSIRTAGWWFRTYTVTDAAITIDEGILQRRHRVVPFSRIQQVELRQPLTSRLFGIVTVHVETAGDASTTAISLRSLDLPTAEALREHLLAEQRRVRDGRPAGGRAPGDQWSEAYRAPTRTTLLRLRPGHLLAAGVTSSPPITTAIVAVVPSALIAGTNVDGAGALVLFGALVAGATLVIACIAAVAALLSGWGFELTASDDDLHVTQGLLDRRQHSMPRHRLQHVRVTDNPLRRALGIAGVELFSAATPGRNDQQQTAIAIPLARRDALAELLVLCMGSDRWRPPGLEPRSPAARRRAVARRTLATSALAVPLVWLLFPAGLVLAPLALLGIPWGRLAHRRAGSALGGDVLVVASGVLVHHLELVPAERVQSARTIASPFQRRLRLATLRLDVAGASRRQPAPGLADLGQHVATAASRAAPIQSRRARP